MKPVIQFKSGSMISGNAERVYSELEKLRKRDGDITPSAVVDTAKAKRNPMHKYFEWDNDSAADRYRLEQARKLVRSIEIIHVEAPNVPAKAYSVVTKPAAVGWPERKVYQSTEEALKDPVQRDEILGNAIRDAIAFRRKYAALQELAQVFTVMDDVISNFELRG